MTVMVKFRIVPTHVLAIGVTVKLAITGVEPALIAAKLGCPFVPLASTPILDTVFVHV